MFSKNIGKRKGGEATMKEILEILTDDAMKENLNTLSTTKNTAVKFSVREVGENDNNTIRVLVTAGQHYDLDHLSITGAICQESEFVWYYCHVRKMSNGTIQIFLKGIIEKQLSSDITAC